MRACLCRWTIVATLTLSSANAWAGQKIEILAGTYIKDLMIAMSERFEQSHPEIDIVVSTGPRSDDDLVQELLRRSTVSAPMPDMVVTGSGLRLLADKDIAVPIDNLMEGDATPALRQASPTVLEKGMVNGQHYGVAFGLSMPVVLFNEALVARAGGDPLHLPAEWPDILAMARQINQLGAPVVGGFIEADNTGALSLLYLLQSHGGQLMDAGETTLTLNTPAGLQAMKVLQGFGDAGQAQAAMTRDQARQAFGSGTIGVLVTMSSTIARLEKAASGKFAIRSVSLPLTVGGSVPTAGPIALVLSRDPAKANAQSAFLNFLVGEDGQQTLVEKSGYLPTNETAIATSSSLQTLLDKQPNAEAVTRRLPVATGWFEPPGDNAARIASIVNDHLFNVVTAKTSPEAALADLSNAIGPLLPASN